MRTIVLSGLPVTIVERIPVLLSELLTIEAQSLRTTKGRSSAAGFENTSRPPA
jgi:hypothetical protein